MISSYFLAVVVFTAFSDVVWAGSHREATLYADTLLRVSLPAQFQNHSMDPRTLPDFEIRSQSSHRINVKGTFQQGRMTGLSGLYRIGQCSPPASVPGGNVTFTCTMGVDKLNLTYNAKIKYGVLPSSTSHVQANLTRPFGVMEVTSAPRGTSPILKRFTVATLGQLDTSIHGGLFKNEFPHLNTEFMNMVIQDVQQIMSESFPVALGQAVVHTPLPSGIFD